MKRIDEKTEKRIYKMAKDIYQDGYFDGYNDGVGDRNIDIKSKVSNSYVEGLNDAWECARKIVLNPDSGGLSTEELLYIFNSSNVQWLLKSKSSFEVVTKIKEYEEKQNICNDCLKKDTCETVKNGLSVVQCQQKQTERLGYTRIEQVQEVVE